MDPCCICGTVEDEESGTLMVNGFAAPLCSGCAKLLDEAGALRSDDARRAQIRSRLNEKLKKYDAEIGVIESVNGFFEDGDPHELKAFLEAEEAEYRREKAEEATEADGRSSIHGIVHFLSVFAVIFLVLGILASYLIGVPMMHYRDTSLTGWIVIIGGTIMSILAYACITLTLSVASAIGSIDEKLSDTNDRIDTMNERLARFADMFSAYAKKQKK